GEKRPESYGKRRRHATYAAARKNRSRAGGEPSLERFESVDRRQARRARANPCGGRFAVLMRARERAGELSCAGKVERAHPRTVGTFEQPLPRSRSCRVAAQQYARRRSHPFFEG